MSEEELEELKKPEALERGAVLFGAPISMIIIWGAIVAVSEMIPVMFYLEGGAMFSLAECMGTIVGLVLGPYAGFVAGVIGGTIGLFLNPAAYPVPFTGILGPGIAALIAGWTANGKWKWVVLFFVYAVVQWLLIPWYWPGMETIPELWLTLIWVGYAPIAIAIIIGHKLPEWLRSEDPKKLFIAIWITTWLGRESNHTWGWAFYNWFFSFPAALNFFIGVFVVWWQAIIIYTVAAVIGTAIIMALRKSGLRKVRYAIW